MKPRSTAISHNGFKKSAQARWQPARMDYNSQRNYFFRVQTVSDTNGNVKSALYGKIYGDFMQFRYF